MTRYGTFLNRQTFGTRYDQLAHTWLVGLKTEVGIEHGIEFHDNPESAKSRAEELNNEQTIGMN